MSDRRLIDLTGKRFGRWTALAYVGGGGRTWSCVCDCGTCAVVHGQTLRNGHSRSCGCAVLIDLTGKRFGRWKVLDYAGDKKWHCRCDCGTRRIVRGAELRDGGSRSCGCLARECATKHGHARRGQVSKEYRAWAAMKTRCNNPRTTGFANYGGRGLGVCEQYHEFVPWLADIGPAPSPSHTQDRTNNDLGYLVGNIGWADRKQQRLNQRPRRNRKLRIKLGDPKILAALEQLNKSLARAAGRSS